MTILVVDNDPDRLWELVRELRQLYPDKTVEYTHDPMMAGRFAYNNSVDVLITQLVMRFDGIKLAELVRKNKPDIKVYLMATAEEFSEWDIFEDEVPYKLITRPVAVKETLGKIFARAPCRSGEKNKTLAKYNIKKRRNLK